MMEKIRVNRIGLLAIWALFVLFGCTDSVMYSNAYSFDNNTWKAGQAAKFEVDVTDTEKAYDFVLTLRTTTSFKYSNLWIFWITTNPAGETVREPFEMRIVDPAGYWLGKKSGSIIECQLHFNARKFPTKGKYVFQLEQAVTQQEIAEVLDVSLVISEQKQK